MQVLVVDAAGQGGVLRLQLSHLLLQRHLLRALQR